MKVGLALALAVNTQVFALDIPALIDSLGPAPASDPRWTNPVPPGPGDVRSPCPGLNALANHGFLNHNGKNMTIPGLLVGLAAGMNIAADFSVIIGAGGLLSAPDPLGGSFDLDMLDQHLYPIEHDASLSRQDTYFGNNHVFYEPNWMETLANYAGDTETSIVASAEARYARYNTSLATNPTFVYGAKEFALSYGETALYLTTMSSPLSNGVAPLSYVKMLFENETLPWELGWRPSPIPITLGFLGAQSVQIFAAIPQAVPEGISIVADSYQDVFEQEIGGADALGNLTQGISTYLGIWT